MHCISKLKRFDSLVGNSDTVLVLKFHVFRLSLTYKNLGSYCNKMCDKGTITNNYIY